MNTLRDVQKILEDDIKPIGPWIEREQIRRRQKPDVTIKDFRSIYREAEKRLLASRAKLTALKLSEKDRMHMSLLRRAIEKLILAMQAGRRDKYDKSTQLANDAYKLMLEYVTRMLMLPWEKPHE